MIACRHCQASSPHLHVSWENTRHGSIEFCRCLLCGWRVEQPRRRPVVRRQRISLEPDLLAVAIIKAGRLAKRLAGITEEITMKRRGCYCDE